MKSMIGFFPALLLSATVIAQGGVDDAQSFFPQRLSAQALLTHCASSSMTARGRQQQGYCAGFVSGVEETLRLASPASSARALVRFCVPEGESARGIADAYVRYAGRRTTDLAKPAALVVIEALETSYPCRE